MRTTVYTCDICKQSKSYEDLAKIIVKAEGIKIKDVNQYNGLEIEICSDCLKKKGFIVDFNKEDAEQTAAKNKVTLEDKIYEILEDMGVAFQE